MLKRLARLFGRDTGAAAPLPPAAAEQEPMRAYDAFGREVLIQRSDWLTKVLQPNLQRHWNEADALYGHLLDGLDSGFAEHLLPAARQLHALDAGRFPERGSTMLGIALMKNGRADQAKVMLTEALQRVGRSAVLLVNLAKAHAELGETEQADALLWEGVERDPNLENGLGWWLALAREREGEPGYLAALHKASGLPGSWLPQLWLARHQLETRALPEALALYREVLAHPVLPDAALMMISGDLGRNDQVALIPELVAARYDADRGDPVVGLNLLQAYRQLGHWQQGEALLHRLLRRELAPWRQRFDEFSAAFTQQRLAQAQTQIVAPEQVQVETHCLSQPIWTYGLREPNWLLRAKPESVPVVVCLPLACPRGASDPARNERETETGRRSRALALYWAEAIHNWSPLAGHVYLPVGNGSAPVVFGEMGDARELAAALPAQVQFLVQGSLQTEGEQTRIRLQLWSRATATVLLDQVAECPHAELGSVVLELERALLAQLGPSAATPAIAGYRRHDAEAMPAYLDGLGQLLVLTLIANGVGSKDSLWGEREMLEWPLNLCLRWPEHPQHVLMLLATLSKAQAYRSTLMDELKGRVQTLLAERARGDATVARLMPLAWKLLGMSTELQAAQARHPSQDEYGVWLRGLNED